MNRTCGSPLMVRDSPSPLAWSISAIRASPNSAVLRDQQGTEALERAFRVKSGVQSTGGDEIEIDAEAFGEFLKTVLGASRTRELLRRLRVPFL